MQRRRKVWKSWGEAILLPKYREEGGGVNFAPLDPPALRRIWGFLMMYDLVVVVKVIFWALDRKFVVLKDKKEWINPNLLFLFTYFSPKLSDLKKCLEHPGAQKIRVWHHHGSDTPTSPKSIFSKLSIKRPVLLNDLVWIFPKGPSQKKNRSYCSISGPPRPIFGLY